MEPKRILVVDRDQAAVDLCKLALNNEGYDFIGITSTENVLDVINNNYFNLAIIDRAMQCNNGYDLYSHLREKMPDLLGILMTDYLTLDETIQAMKIGYSAFIRKPFNEDELKITVTSVFDKAYMLEENARLKTLIPLYELSKKFIKCETEKEIFQDLLSTISHHTGSKRISIMLYDKSDGYLKIKAAKGIKPEICEITRTRPGDDIAGQVFKSGKPLILNRASEISTNVPFSLKNRDILAAISFPLMERDRVIGVLNVSEIKKVRLFSQADVEMLSVICSQAMMALESVRITKEKEEKIRLRTLLEQYIDPEVADVLLNTGINPIELGEVKKITILFADIRGFTHLVQEVPLELLRSFLNEFFGLLSDAVIRHKGILDKFMGDSVLAIFGAPMFVKKPNDVAVLAAIEMQEKFSHMIEEWTSKAIHFRDVGLGIGITSGESFLGNVGYERRLDYTVIGMEVNLAQRMASEAVGGEILLTEKVTSQLSPSFNLVEKKACLFKGIETAVPVFSVIKNKN